MTDARDDELPGERHASLDRPMTAEAEADFGPVRFKARASTTPAGLVATGAAVSMVLLAAAVVVWASRRRR